MLAEVAPTPTGVNWLDYIVIPAAAVMALGVFIRATVKTIKLFRRVNHFLDDFFGHPARKGVPEQPGLMTRVEALEGADKNLAESHKELTTKVDDLYETLRDDVAEDRRKALDEHVRLWHVQPEGTS